MALTISEPLFCLERLDISMMTQHGSGLGQVLLNAVKGHISGANTTSWASERDIMSSGKERERSETVHLEWRDYVAMVIAFFETTLLPILVMIGMLLFVLVVIRR
jgi:hypothetical protein